MLPYVTEEYKAYFMAFMMMIMIGVAFYKMRPYKSSKFKAQIGELFCKNSGELLNVAKSLARLCMGPSNPKTNSWHNKETRKIAPKILAPRGHKSLQYNQNYNQVFTLLMFQNKDLFNT